MSRAHTMSVSASGS